MKKEEESRVGKLLVALASGLILSLGLTLLFAVLVSGGTVPETRMGNLVLVAALPGAFWSALRAARTVGVRTLWVGLAAGLGFFLALFFLGGLLYLRWMPSPEAVPLLLCTLLGGLLGGLLGSRKKRKY